MTVGKYWDELAGSYGCYAKNNATERPIRNASAPDEADWAIIKNEPLMRFMQARFSWRSLEPTTQGEYAFAEIDKFLADAERYQKFVRVELMPANPVASTNILRNGTPAERLALSPVPAYMFEKFDLDASKSTGPYGGGCFAYAKGDARSKLWPRFWIPGVHEAFADMCAALLWHIRAKPEGKWFAGFQITETLLQQADQLCIGNPDKALNWSGEKTLTGYLHITDRISETWNEPLHSIFANWGDGPNGVMSREQWQVWLDKACLEQAWGYGHPDTLSIHDLGGGDCVRDLKWATETSIGQWAYDRYQDRGIIIQSTQNSGTNCNGEGPNREPVTLLDYARGAIAQPKSGRKLKANLLFAAGVRDRKPDRPNSWSIFDFIKAVNKDGGTRYALPTAKIDPVFHNVSRDSGAIGEPVKPEPEKPVISLKRRIQQQVARLNELVEQLPED